MQIKTSELIGAALNWAVAKCEGGHIGVDNKGVFFDAHDGDGFTSFEPSTDWGQGGPIIEREMIQITPHCMINPLYGWAAAFRSFDEDDDVYALFRKRGKTPLVAAMRCYVTSKLGEFVEVPDELKG
jgi:hypothetical protein